MIIVGMALMVIACNSCKKNVYCHCYAAIDDEVVSLGDDIDISNMTEEDLEKMTSRYQYNLYVMEEGTCNDKAKEISGWGQVTCKEAETKDDDTWEWLLGLFTKNKTKSN